MRIAVVFVALALTACATPQQRFQQDVAGYRASCQAAGFDLETNPGRQCVLSMWQEGEAARSRRLAAVQQLGQTMMEVDAQRAAQRPVMCTSFQQGRWVSTTCQ